MNCQAPGCAAVAAHVVAKHGVALGRACSRQQCVAALIGSAAAAPKTIGSVARVGADPNSDAAKRRTEDFKIMMRTLEILEDIRKKLPELSPMDVLNTLQLIGDSINDKIMADMEERLTRAMQAVVSEMSMMLANKPYDVNVGKQQAKLLTNIIANRTTLAEFDETLKGSEEMEKARLPADVRMLAAIRVNPIQVIAELPAQLTVEEVQWLRRGSMILRANSSMVGITRKYIMFNGTLSRFDMPVFRTSLDFGFWTPTASWSGIFEYFSNTWRLTASPGNRRVTIREDAYRDAPFFKSEPFHFTGFSIGGNILAAFEPQNAEGLRVELFKMDFPDPSTAPGNVSPVPVASKSEPVDAKLTRIGTVTLEGMPHYARNNVAIDESGNIWYCNAGKPPALATDIIVKSPSNVVIARRNNVFPVGLVASVSGGMWAGIDRAPELVDKPFNTYADVVYQHMRLARL